MTLKVHFYWDKELNYVDKKHMCSIQCTLGGDWIVEKLTLENWLTSKYNNEVISATAVLATSKGF